MKTRSARQRAITTISPGLAKATAAIALHENGDEGNIRPNHLRPRSNRRSDVPGRRVRKAEGRRALTSARQWFTTVGEVVLDGLVTGVAAVAAVALLGAAALALAVVLLGWWF